MASYNNYLIGDLVGPQLDFFRRQFSHDEELLLVSNHVKENLPPVIKNKRISVKHKNLLVSVF